MAQLDLFSSEAKIPKNKFDALNKVKGLVYCENYISSEEHFNLLHFIDNQDWLGDLKRRVQHYGYKYDYKSRKIDYSMFIGDLPAWASHLAQRLYNDGYINSIPDQVIVNEYLPGQGIAHHIDCVPCFDDTIISLSLGSPCIMDILYKFDRTLRVEVLLEPRSLIVLKGESRYKWLHGISARKIDNFNGISFNRERRVSLTFRKVIIE
ncbi:alpha-ketoglutarate-dependent dioxygenase AlkB [Rufibacter glacialis]|nr:alpha-ketoglutarate-dependent dioxygenase AlkB [Rufibacter glacialis]